MNIAILGSFILSIWHSILFWDKNWGISMVLFFIPFILFVIYCLGKIGKIKDKKACILIIPITLLALTYGLFSNEWFSIINIIVILGLIAIMSIWLTSGDVKLKLLISKIFSVLLGPIELFGESGKRIKGFLKTEQTEENKKQIFKKLGKALLITIPIVLIVLFLLMSADTIFADTFGWVSNCLEKLFVNYEIVYIAIRIGLIFILGIYLLSYIINLTEEHSSYSVVEEVNQRKEVKIESFTMNSILTVLNVIYLIFSIIQFTYLFTGAGREENFNYAQYARQGFFQLLFVSLINFILLFVSNVHIKKSNQYTKWMNILLAIFTGIIVISSFFRMHLYQQEYGYTYLRLAVDFILITEMLLLIPTIIYLINKKVHLLKIGFMIIITMYIIANYVNFDYVIAKNNIDNYFENEQENKIDLYYLKTHIGIDAIPEITRLVNAEDNSVSKDIRNYLQKQKQLLGEEEDSWQEYNYSKEKVKRILNNITD